MFEWGDFFSLHALLAAFGWTVATAMAIRHLHVVEQNRLLSVILIGLCIAGIVGSLVEGARESAERRLVVDGIGKIQETIKSGNQSPDQILAAAASKLIEQGKRITELEQKNADRDIPDDMRNQMVALLKTVGPYHVEVVYEGNGDDIEQVRFAEKLRSIFVDAGWRPPPIGGFTDQTRPPLIGIHFVCRNPKKIPAYFPALVSLFDKTNDPVSGGIGRAPNLPDENSIAIIAGHDPKK
jgi:hypothetical protein